MGSGKRAPTTAEELAAAGPRYERCELWDGTLAVRDPSGGWPGPLATRLTARLLAHVEPNDLGWVGDSSTAYILRRRPDRVLAPDLSFVAKTRLARWPQAGFTELVPDLVAEIRSTRDSWTRVAERGGIWIAHGVPIVWLIDPLPRRVISLRPAVDPIEAGPGGSFSAGPALPGLVVTVDDLFAPFS